MDCLPIIHVSAYHAKAGYNGNTPGIGALCGVSEDTRIGIGTYYNSINRQSNYAMIAYQPLKIGNASVGAFIGGVTGYQTHTIPFAAIAISFPIGPLELHTAIIPETYINPTTLSVSFSFK